MFDDGSSSITSFIKIIIPINNIPIKWNAELCALFHGVKYSLATLYNFIFFKKLSIGQNIMGKRLINVVQSTCPYFVSRKRYLGTHLIVFILVFITIVERESEILKKLKHVLILCQLWRDYKW